MQAEDILMLDIGKIASFADYFIILTSGADRQTRALREEMLKRLKDLGVRVGHIEGNANSGWQLLDFGDVIVHIMGHSDREFYKLEELWKEAPEVVRIQ
jgi:ribosome-associated protein